LGDGLGDVPLSLARRYWTGESHALLLLSLLLWLLLLLVSLLEQSYSEPALSVSALYRCKKPRGHSVTRLTTLFDGATKKSWSGSYRVNHDAKQTNKQTKHK
jgi:hypothetical protein